MTSARRNAFASLPPRRIAGVMTGTSLDGIDAALVEVTGRGWDIDAHVIGAASLPLDDLAERLRGATAGDPLTAHDWLDLSTALGRRHVDVVRALPLDGRPPDLVAAHGQTLLHVPPRSLQLLDTASIGTALHCPVVTNMRRADLDAGGQGAPITPLADWILLRGPERRAIVNLGGFCNITLLPASGMGAAAHAADAAALRGAVRGFDVCACNHLLDTTSRIVLDRPFDEDGRAAEQGTPDPDLADAVTARLHGQRAEERSLGSGDELHSLVQQGAHGVHGHDLLASVVAGVARCIGEALNESDCDAAFVAGGGSRNSGLLAGIQRCSNVPVEVTDVLGLAADVRESAAMGVLGCLLADGHSATLPAVTGRNPEADGGAIWWLPTGSDANPARMPGVRHATPNPI